MTKDMTKGSPFKLILGFAFPMLLGMLFQQFYNLVDTMIVGKTLGVSALAGVGATSSINFMIIGFCMGICNGFANTALHTYPLKTYFLSSLYLDCLIHQMIYSCMRIIILL